jgi:hypothetical protein
MLSEMKRKLGKNQSLRLISGNPYDEVQEFINSGEYAFWTAHGINYLNSDMATGTWKPLFEIYEGNPNLSIEHIIADLKSKFCKDGIWDNEGKVLAVWAVQGAGSSYHLYKKTKTIFKDTTWRLPHYEGIWEFFNAAKVYGMKDLEDKELVNLAKAQ